MNLRIQTYGEYINHVNNTIIDHSTIDEVNVIDVLEKGLKDLMALCDVVTDKFIIARDNFPKTAPSEAA